MTDLNKIKVIAMDCDGTLTDGKMIFLGAEQLKFSMLWMVWE